MKHPENYYEPHLRDDPASCPVCKDSPLQKVPDAEVRWCASCGSLILPPSKPGSVGRVFGSAVADAAGMLPAGTTARQVRILEENQ